MRPVEDALQRAPGTVWRSLGERVLALAPGRREPAVLAGVAAEAWRRLAAPTTVDELVEGLAGHYGMAPSAVEQDVRRFVDELGAAGLVHSAPRDP
jgi:hypothetical protein